MRTFLSKAWLLTLLLAVAFIPAACGSAGGGAQGDEAGGGGGHGKMGHGSMGSKDMARQMVMQDGKYSNERFIDAMVPHHQSAIYMAQVANRESENARMKELAGNIVSAQKGEIEQMKQWRREWYQEG